MKERRVGPWTVRSKRIVFDNPWITVVDHAVIHPDGSPGQYAVVRFKNRAIGVLPIDDQGNVWLVGQHRFPLDAYSWELPEGGGELADEPLAAAKRELIEETGLTATDWLPLASFDLSNSVTDEAAVCFLAAGLSEGRSAPEPSEALTVRQAPFKEVFESVLKGEIRDSLTVIMMLAAYAKALRGELPATISRAILSGPSAGENVDSSSSTSRRDR
jgi:8-oxo-dGTP pyrophosphatase MutT (NUDIX family)